MSLVDLDKLAPSDLIVHYVLECQGRNLFLPYEDYQIVDEWLGATADADALLLVLSDVLPVYFAVRERRPAPRSLRGVRRLVLSRLKDQAMRQTGRAP